MLSRRTALMAAIAAMGQMLLDDHAARAQVGSSTVKGNLLLWKPPESLTVHLGEGGYKQFTFVDGTNTVTFTAAELMQALKEGT